MLKGERRNGDDRRKTEALSGRPPFLTRDGLVYSERRRNPDRRNSRLEQALEFGEVEEIELHPVRYA